MCCFTEQAKHFDSGVTYRKEFVSFCQNLFNYGLKEHEKREAEVSDFYEGLNEALTANQQEGRKIILDFENEKKKVMLLYFVQYMISLHPMPALHFT